MFISSRLLIKCTVFYFSYAMMFRHSWGCYWLRRWWWNS